MSVSRHQQNRLSLTHRRPAIRDRLSIGAAAAVLAGGFAVAPSPVPVRAAAATGVSGAAAPGPPAPVVTRPLSAGAAEVRKCHDRRAERGRGVDAFRLTAPSTGVVRVRFQPVADRHADWDLAVFDSAGRLVAGSAGPHSAELADGHVVAGDILTVQGCRYAGRVRTVRADVSFHPDPPTASSAARAAAATQATSTPRSGLPSGRTSYRRLPDYEYEMKELARRNPHLVRLIVLPYRTVEGREQLALEITRDVTASADGKPVFLNTAAHHPPEWIAAEHAMEWAYDLVTSYPREARTRKLLSRARAVVVPLVNPDGFAVTREAYPAEVVDGYPADLTAYEFLRKNCSAASVPADQRGGVCLQNPAANRIGVDLNRNYGGMWGGPGAGSAWDSMYFRGPAPFSEPEVRNLRSLYTGRQVVTAVNNHSAANLIIRPPDLIDREVSVDENVAAELAARMRDHNGYHSVRGWQLYDTSGGAETWAHGVGGTMAYTIEIGEWLGFQSLHPPFTRHVDEYLGRGTAPGAGKGGNREVYYTMLAATLEPKYHSTITGTLPDGWTLTAHKRVSTPTAPVLQPDGTETAPLHYTDRFGSSLRGTGGPFRWTVNPSTRPQLAGRAGRTPAAPAQAAVPLPNPAGEPPVDAGEPLQKAHEEVPFTVTGLPAHDNGFARVRIEWSDPGTDYDLYVLDPDGYVVGMSVNGYQEVRFEEAVLIDPAPGVYRAVIQKVAGRDDADGDDWGNGSVTFAAPKPGAEGVTESWTLTCRRPGGAPATTRRVEVVRGATADVGDVCRH